jgi:DNA repair protein RadD
MATYELRDYQREAVAAGLDAIERGRNGILSMPAGSGKSLVIAGMATAMETNIVVLQPTKEILEQNARKLYEFGHRDMAICSASVGQKRRARVTFATIGTIINRMEWFSDTGLVVVDECHLVNAKAGQYRDFIEAIGKPAIGLTATPYRMATAFGGEVVEAKFLHRTRPRVFNNISYVVQNDELHRTGYLVPIVYEKNEDYDPYQIALKSTGLNYDERALAAYNEEKGICEKVVATVLGALDDARHILVFVAAIAESQAIEEMLARAGVAVAHVDGTTPKAERERILAGFQSGAIRVVTNVGVLTTGFDFPALDVVVLGRPTMSLPLYYQMVGRGVRRSPGKEFCRVFDLCGNVDRFGRPDEYRVEADDGYKFRLRSGERYLTGVNFRNGRDLEKARDKAARRHQALAGATADTVTFGKYSGNKVSEVPVDYLAWCVKKFDDGKWKDIFSEELRRRQAAGVSADA